MGMTVEIRKARPEDKAALVEMMESQLRQSYGHFMPADHIDAWLAGGETAKFVDRLLDHIVVPVRDGAVVGMASIGDAMLEFLWVSAESRGSGVGQALLAYAEQQWRQAGHTVGRLECWPVNEQAMAFYKTAGYRVASVNADDEAPYLDKAMMEKALA
jgi:ribosomal protein S18 acetylase RimI-like enzyme